MRQAGGTSLHGALCSCSWLCLRSRGEARRLLQRLQGPDLRQVRSRETAGEASPPPPPRALLGRLPPPEGSTAAAELWCSPAAPRLLAGLGPTCYCRRPSGLLSLRSEHSERRRCQVSPASTEGPQDLHSLSLSVPRPIAPPGCSFVLSPPCPHSQSLPRSVSLFLAPTPNLPAREDHHRQGAMGSKVVARGLTVTDDKTAGQANPATAPLPASPASLPACLTAVNQTLRMTRGSNSYRDCEEAPASKPHRSAPREHPVTSHQSLCVCGRTNWPSSWRYDARPRSHEPNIDFRDAGTESRHPPSMPSPILPAPLHTHDVPLPCPISQRQESHLVLISVAPISGWVSVLL
jgi:hypothetical protein